MRLLRWLMRYAEEQKAESRQFLRCTSWRNQGNESRRPIRALWPYPAWCCRRHSLSGTARGTKVQLDKLKVHFHVSCSKDSRLPFTFSPTIKQNKPLFVFQSWALTQLWSVCRSRWWGCTSHSQTPCGLTKSQSYCSRHGRICWTPAWETLRYRKMHQLNKHMTNQDSFLHKPHDMMTLIEWLDEEVMTLTSSDQYKILSSALSCQ